ncbi:response regulator transcription factor [Thauera sp. 2A1]|uniref:response regulator n=1 Tax=Thauera sp. 2A1 TaxID=2570191 RepID=UPI00129150B4|nr:response regulator transcription factor [Thauera sp. 2A1]KAI5915652.1 response regulator transcription factor [Thauera sp. 2A1]
MRILIVDDHPVMRFGVRQLVERRWPEADIGEAENLLQALHLARGQAWQVAVLDLSLPDAVGLEGLAQLRRAAPALPVLVLSMHGEAAYATQALQLGAAGYLTKEHATSELVTAIDRVCGGGRYISSDLAARLADLLTNQGGTRAPHETLSPQEHRVMLLIAAGKSASEIADVMHLSVKTVGTYRSRIIDKTGLANTAEIARYCASRGLIDLS